MSENPNWRSVRALAGMHSKRSIVGSAVLGVILLVVTAAEALPRWVLFDGENTGLAGTLDGLISIAIFLAVLANLLAILYALWNGGPGLSFLFPIAPLVVGWLFAGQITVAIDLAIALAAGTLAATLATMRLMFATTEIDRALRRRGLELGIGIAGFGAILGGLAVYRVSDVAGPHAQSGLVVAGLLYGITVLCLVGLLAHLGWHQTGGTAPTARSQDE